MPDFVKVKPAQRSTGLDMAGMSCRELMSVLSRVSYAIASIDNGSRMGDFRIDNLISKTSATKGEAALKPKDWVLYGGVEQALTLVASVGESYPEHGNRQLLGSSFQSLIQAVNQVTLSRFLLELGK